MDATTIGIVAEYNPFHHGHAYQIQQAIKKTGAKHVVVCMSGNFIQRGTPAILDKWRRCRSALLCGADIVIELPLGYATASAEAFAQQGVGLLAASGIVDCLVFGCESAQPEPLYTIAALLADEPLAYQQALKSYLQTGVSFPVARQKAVAACIGNDAALLQTPNNILAIEYIKALRRLSLSPPISSLPITRSGFGYHDVSVGNQFVSATAIRRLLLEGETDALLPLLPHNSYRLLMQAVKEGAAPICANDYSDILLYRIKTMGAKGLLTVAGVLEGLENRILKATDNAHTFTGIADAVKTKRYTHTRIQRILLHALLQIDPVLYNDGVAYIRILGFKKERAHLLKELINKSSLPVIINPKKDFKPLNPKACAMFEQECKSTDIYFMKMHNQHLRRSGQEFTLPVVVV